MELLFTAVDEARAGAKWQALFQRHWPAYRQWFLSEGMEPRPTYGQALRQLKAHMPELLPTYERLCELAGGGDLEARFLALYRPPAYLTGCSQAVWLGDDPLLVRNYDYAPALARGRSCAATGTAGRCWPWSTACGGRWTGSTTPAWRSVSPSVGAR
jgi:predicted choloylglycine hydrolase